MIHIPKLLSMLSKLRSVEVAINCNGWNLKRVTFL